MQSLPPETARQLFLDILCTADFFNSQAADVVAKFLRQWPVADLASIVTNLFRVLFLPAQKAGFGSILRSITTWADPESLDGVSFDWDKLKAGILPHWNYSAFGSLIAWCVPRNAAFENEFLAHFVEWKEKLSTNSSPRDALKLIADAYVAAAMRRRDVVSRYYAQEPDCGWRLDLANGGTAVVSIGGVFEENNLEIGRRRRDGENEWHNREDEGGDRERREGAAGGRENARGSAAE
jgi:hypothetical protein